VRRFPEKIVLLGMTPERAEPGFGCLGLGSPVADPDQEGVFRVAAFVEKPGLETAERMVRSGALWNSFVMLFRVERLIALLRQRRPSDCDAFRRSAESAYASIVPWNFSRDFLAQVPEELLVLRVGDVGWSDWGTREAIERTLRHLHVVPPWCTALRAAEAAA
jgi:mannose-1-phosphate guanylyltransferase